ncbi:MAG: MarR family transcriptional regulator [Acetatifactor sp.]|nr:MarR family transcriptional regulator [Acetatifactor sp.]
MVQTRKRSMSELLAKLFNHIMDMESKAVITEEFSDITNNDMHIIEAIGVSEHRNMSAIAHNLSVTVSTLTTNMNGLEKKGYIVRERSLEDKRVVYVVLTEKGKKAFFHHRDFHKKMIKAIMKDLSEEEMEILYRCLSNLTGFLESSH